MAREPEVIRIGIAELRTRLGVSGRTVSRWVAARTFPAPHYLGPNVRRWFLADVEAWEREQMARLAPPSPASPAQLDANARP